MIKKIDLRLTTMIMSIMAGVLALVVGMIFYVTFEQVSFSIYIPELESFKAWTPIAMFLGFVSISVTVVNYFTPKKKGWSFTLITTLVLATILEIVLTILLFKIKIYVSNSQFCLCCHFLQ